VLLHLMVLETILSFLYYYIFIVNNFNVMNQVFTSIFFTKKISNQKKFMRINFLKHNHTPIKTRWI